MTDLSHECTQILVKHTCILSMTPANFGRLIGPHTYNIHCVIKVLHILCVQFEEWCKFFHKITNLRCNFPAIP